MKNLKVLSTILVLAILLLLAFSLFRISPMKQSQQQTLRYQTPVVRPTPVSSPTLTLTIEPSVQKEIPREGYTFTVSVVGKTEEELLATDLSIAYDAESLSVQDITPGDFFQDPMTFSNTIDRSSGKIFYALGSLRPSRMRGTLLTITFTAEKKTDNAVVSLEDKTIAATKQAKKATVVIEGQGNYVIR